jgi:hypothetical protein
MAPGRLYLSKSDFKVARTCPTKLYYKKNRYPSLQDEDPYLELLADGGFMVETMAKLLFPQGREIGRWDRPDEAFEETRRALEEGDGALFEATLVHGRMMARVDILERRGRSLRLIEVKAASFDSERDGANPFRGKQGTIRSEWRPYLEDVAFQAVVLSRAFPEFAATPCLCLVDKARAAGEHATFDKFRLRRGTRRHGMERPEVLFTGDAEMLRATHVLALLDVSSEVEEIRSEVTRAAESFAETLSAEPIARIPPALGQRCKHCEYRLDLHAEGPSGFRECWGALADADPHILDLYRADLLGGKGKDVVAAMASRGQSRLEELPRDEIRGKAAARQEIQLRHTAEGTEYISPELKGLLASHSYPLHFIDFETSACALPYHPGMHPYEKAAFQWSCHTIPGPGAPLEHAEWLQDEEGFPNFAFARALRERIGERGTVYIWSPYERTVLKEIRDQMERYGEDDPVLASWLEWMARADNSRIVDLYALAKEHYFHPRMKGSLSIKQVLPAVWESDPEVRDSPAFRQYRRIEEGRLLSPYDALPPLPVGEREEVVTEGTGAMRTYQEMMFGESAGNPEQRQTLRRLLLQYCELDTAAMVMIWSHWNRARA